MAGIEYEINGGPYQRYDGPVTVLVGDTITYRAVDVNGNVEASHDLTACTATGWPVPVGDSDCDGQRHGNGHTHCDRHRNTDPHADE